MSKSKVSKLLLIAGVVTILCGFGTSSKAISATRYKHMQVYIVKNGDCISSIAMKHRQDFESTNNVISRIQRINNVKEIIYPGQKLLIPVE